MTYKMLWQLISTKAIIRSESYQDLDKALDAANFALIGGSSPVEVIVIDEEGNQHSRFEPPYCA